MPEWPKDLLFILLPMLAESPQCVQSAVPTQCLVMTPESLICFLAALKGFGRVFWATAGGRFVPWAISATVQPCATGCPLGWGEGSSSPVPSTAAPLCLGQASGSLHGADVLYGLSCSKNPCLELWRACSGMLLCACIPGAAQGRLPGLVLNTVNCPWSGRSLLGAGPCCSVGAP